MTNYVVTTDFSAKDALPSGNPAKTAKGTEVNAELVNIATAVATKEDTANKGVNNGYAGLDSSGKIATSAVPSTVALLTANTFTALQKIAVTSEAMRLVGSAPFFSGYNAADTVRTGYLQFDAATPGVQLNAEHGDLVLASGTGNVLLQAIGVVSVNSVSIRDGNILSTGTVGAARLGSGSPSSSNFLRGDSSWTQPSSITISDYASGTWTATLGGVTGSVTGTGAYVRFGNLVHIHVPAMTGTSNSNQLTVTGLPFTASRSQNVGFAHVIQDSGTPLSTPNWNVQINGATLSIGHDYDFNWWNASGSKGITNQFSVTYLLN